MSARQIGHIGLGVATAHAQGVQLHHLAGIVFVHMAEGILRIVEVEQHLRRKQGGAQQRAEAAQRMRGDDALGVVAHHRPDIAAADHIEVIQPEPAQPLLQGVGGVEAEQHLLRRRLLGEGKLEGVERLELRLNIRRVRLGVVLACLADGTLLPNDGGNQHLKWLIHWKRGKLRGKRRRQVRAGLLAQLRLQIGRCALLRQHAQLLRAGAPADAVEKDRRAGTRRCLQPGREPRICPLQGLREGQRRLAAQAQRGSAQATKKTAAR